VVAAANSGITVNADDLTITLQTNPGLQLGASGLAILIDPTDPGLAVGAAGVVVDLQTPSGLELAASGLAVADSLAGSGLNIASKVMSVDWAGLDLSTYAGDGLVWDAGNVEIDLGTPGTLTTSTTNAVTASSHTHEITTTDNAATTTSTILAGDSSGDITLRRVFIGDLIRHDGDADTWIQLEPDAIGWYMGGVTRMQGSTTDIRLRHATDFIIYSDGGTTEEARIDGATGYIGIGTVPTAALHIKSSGTPQFILDNNDSDIMTTAMAAAGTVTITSPKHLYYVNAAGSVRYDMLTGVGINTWPSKPFHILSTTTEQARIGYDASNYAGLQVQADGHLIFNTTGTDADMSLAPADDLFLQPSGYIMSTAVHGFGGGFTPTIPAQIRSTSLPQLSVEYDASNTGWLQTSASGAMTVAATTDLIIDATAGDVWLNAGDDIIVNPDGANMNPNLNWAVDLGSTTKLYRTLYAAELNVQTLVAEDILSTIGGRILVGPTTVLVEDLSGTPATGSEALTNGNFESWASATDANSWTESGTVQRNSDAHGGTWAARVAYSGSARSSVAQSVSASNDTYYKLLFWVKIEHELGANPQYSVYDNGNAAYLISPTDIAGTVGQWVQIRDGLVTASSGTTTIEVKLWSPSATSRDSQSAYVAGGHQSTVPAYMLGSDASGTASSSKSAYMNSGIIDSQAAYMGVDENYGALFDDVSLKDADNIVVKHNEMVDGDIAYMEADGSVEFLRIISNAIEDGLNYGYTVDRDIDGTGPNSWLAGDAVFNTGTGGDGFIDLFSTQSVISRSVGPAIVGNVRNSNTFNDWNEHFAIGNLNGIYGYATDTYGVAVGHYATDTAYLRIDDTNGIRITSNNVIVGQWAPSGTLYIGNQAVDKAHITIDDTNGIRIYSANDVIGQWDISGNLALGEVVTDQSNVFWNNSNKRLEFRGGSSGTNVQSFIDTDGAFTSGGGRVTLDDDGFNVECDTVETTQSARVNFRSPTLSTLTTAYISAIESSGGGGIRAAGWRLNDVLGAHENPEIAMVSLGTSADSTITVTSGLSVSIVSPTLEINQGDADVSGLVIRNSDVAHGITNLGTTDTYGYAAKFDDATGGLRWMGLSEDTQALVLNGTYTNDDTTKTSSALGGVRVISRKKSGAGTTTPGTNANLFVVATSGTSGAVWFVDVEGDTYRAGGSNTFDEHDDIQLIRAFDVVLQSPGYVVDHEFDEFLDYNADHLEELGILYAPGADGRRFYSPTKLQRLQNGALFQLWRKNKVLEDKVAQLEAALLPS
jgi:hypothetical protein